MSHAGCVSSSFTDASTAGQHAGTSLNPVVLSENCCMLRALMYCLLTVACSVASYGLKPYCDLKMLLDLTHQVSMNKISVDHIMLDTLTYPACCIELSRNPESKVLCRLLSCLQSQQTVGI